MKKAAAIFLVFTLIFFTACGAKESPTTEKSVRQVNLPDRINAPFTVTYGSFVGKGQLGYVKDVETVVTMRSPDKISGMKIIVKNDDSYSITHKGITYTNDNSSFAQSLFVNAVIQAMKSAASPTAVEDNGANSVKILGTCTLGDYEIIMDTEKNQVSSVSVPIKGITVTFEYE